MEPSVALKRTPLHAIHVSMGARMVDFGGWEMPVQYTGLVDEHHTVRKAVGLFDVSHMGEIEVRGPPSEHQGKCTETSTRPPYCGGSTTFW